MNVGPLSNIVFFGVPCSFQTWVRNRLATSSAVIDLLQGMKCDILARQSLKVRMESKPLEIGNLTIILYLTSSQGALGAGSGWAGTGVAGPILFLWQESQESTYLLTYKVIPGHV